MLKRLRIYVDVSVYGGCFDEEFRLHSERLFEDVKLGRYVVLVSEIIDGELRSAPKRVRDILASLPDECVETVGVTPDVLDLRDAYLEAGVLPHKWVDDATHVAAATVGGADAIVSWNFRHLVNIRRIMGFNGVNTLHGYRTVQIITPRELVDEDAEEEV